MGLYYIDRNTQQKSHRLDTGQQSAHEALIDGSQGKLQLVVDNQSVDRYVDRATIEVVPGQHKQCTCFWDNTEGKQQLFIRVDEGGLAGRFFEFSPDGVMNNMTNKGQPSYNLNARSEWTAAESHHIYKLKAAATILEQEFFPGQKSFYERHFEAKEAEKAAAQAQVKAQVQTNVQQEPTPQPQVTTKPVSPTETKETRQQPSQPQPAANSRENPYAEARQAFDKHAGNVKTFMQVFSQLRDPKSPQHKEGRSLYGGLILNMQEANKNIETTIKQLQSLLALQAIAKTPAQLDKLSADVKAHQQYVIDQLAYYGKKREIYNTSEKFLRDAGFHKPTKEVTEQNRLMRANLTTLQTTMERVKLEQMKFRDNPEIRGNLLKSKLSHG